MSKKRERSRITNPEPFLPLGSDAFSTGKKRSKLPKHHQLEDKLVPSAVSAKILKEARLQQKEVQREEDDDKNVTDHDDTANKIVFPQIHGRKDDENCDDDGEVDDFEGFSETESQFGQLIFEVRL